MIPMTHTKSQKPPNKRIFLWKKWGEAKQDLSITDHRFEQNRKFIIAVSMKNFETANSWERCKYGFFQFCNWYSSDSRCSIRRRALRHKEGIYVRDLIDINKNKKNKSERKSILDEINKSHSEVRSNNDIKLQNYYKNIIEKVS